MSTPRIYVGTYAKYNDGSLYGKWFDLDDYADKGEFEEACQEYHDRENEVDEDGNPIPAEHEFMYQDWEGIPDNFISESHIDPEFWDYVGDGQPDEVKEAFIACFGEWSAEHCQEDYRGEFRSWADMAEEMAEETGLLESVPENLRYYFDFEKYANDIRCNGEMCEHNNHFFWSR